MKKQLLITAIITILNMSLIQAEGPILKDKLLNPEKIEKQTIQKRSHTWIEAQWKVINNQYQWKSGYWEEKRIGYVFVNGYWDKKTNGWAWKEGYWKKIDLKKWMNLYS